MTQFPTSTPILIACMEVLAMDIDTGNGAASAVVREVAERLRDQQVMIGRLKAELDIALGEIVRLEGGGNVKEDRKGIEEP